MAHKDHVPSLGAANGIATLNGGTLVVQNPANATATATAGKIPIADGSGTLNSWVDGVIFQREVMLVMTSPAVANSTINIQTGSGLATVTGDATTTLPSSAALFASAGAVTVYLNGQSLTRRAVSGDGATWASATQLIFSVQLFIGDEIRVITPLPRS